MTTGAQPETAPLLFISGRSPHLRPRVAADMNGAACDCYGASLVTTGPLKPRVVGDNSPTSPRAQPDFPQRPSRIQASPIQARTDLQQLRPVAGSGQRVDPQVVGNVEGWGVDPLRPAQPAPGPVQELPEARDQGSLGSASG